MEKLTQEYKYKSFIMPTASETRADITKTKQILTTTKMAIIKKTMGKQGLTM
jgi:hypothetical protein